MHKNKVMKYELFEIRTNANYLWAYHLHCESGEWLGRYLQWIRLHNSFARVLHRRFELILVADPPKELACLLPKYSWMFSSPFSWKATDDAYDRIGTHQLEVPMWMRQLKANVAPPISIGASFNRGLMNLSYEVNDD